MNLNTGIEGAKERFYTWLERELDKKGKGSRADLARYLGVKRQYIYLICKKRVNVNEDFVNKINEFLK